MIVGRITKVDGVRAAATFFDRMQPFIVNNGQAVASPRINSFVKTGVGLDTVICQIVGEHEAEYDRRSEVTREVPSLSTWRCGGTFRQEISREGFAAFPL